MAKRKPPQRRSGRKPAGRVARKVAKKAARKTARKPTPRTAPARAPTVASEMADAVKRMRWAHDMTRKLTDGFTGDRATFQSAPTDNHVLWQVGHLASTYSWLASMLDGQPMSLGERYDALFGYKSKPIPDPSQYPPLEEVQRVHDEQFQRLIRAAERSADVLKPLIGDSYGFASTRVDLMHKAAWHEGWHQGQISTLRRAAGLPPLMG